MGGSQLHLTPKAAPVANRALDRITSPEVIRKAIHDPFVKGDDQVPLSVAAHCLLIKERAVCPRMASRIP